MEIRAAGITAFYLYDVAEQIDLSALPSTLGAGASAQLQRKTAAPTYLQYQIPPFVDRRRSRRHAGDRRLPGRA